MRFHEYPYETSTVQVLESMSQTDLIEPEFELDRVEQWRVFSLERAGYDVESAAVLAASQDVDLHRAVSLLERGCSVTLALQILL